MSAAIAATNYIKYLYILIETAFLNCNILYTFFVLLALVSKRLYNIFKKNLIIPDF